MRGAGLERIAVCPEPREPEDHLIAELEAKGYEVVRCKDGTSLLEHMADRAPDLLLYMLDEAETEFPLLRFVRRLAPLMPMVLVARSGSIEVQRMAQGLRPVYYTIAPLEGVELLEAVGSGLRRRTPPGGPDRSGGEDREKDQGSRGRALP